MQAQEGLRSADTAKRDLSRLRDKLRELQAANASLEAARSALSAQLAQSRERTASSSTTATAATTAAAAAVRSESQLASDEEISGDDSSSDEQQQQQQQRRVTRGADVAQGDLAGASHGVLLAELQRSRCVPLYCPISVIGL
jgi:Tfp pilus assembly protein PilX